MKLFLLHILFIASTSFGQNSFEEANALYEEEKYNEAIDAYSVILRDGNESAELYYNLGNAHYRNEDLGRAIWAYESALKIDPDHEDALFNLEFANAQTIDKIDNSRQGLGHWIDGLLYSDSINFWSILSLLSSFILSISIILFLRTKAGSRKNLLLLTASVFALLMISSVVFAGLHKSRLNSKAEGVIISETTEVKMTPTEDAKTSFTLGAGAKIDLVDEDGDWQQIEINGNKGWISKKDIWEI